MSNEIFAFCAITLTEMIIDLSKKKCPGCVDIKRAKLNHLCMQMSLLEKFDSYFPTIAKKILQNSNHLVSEFITVHPEYNMQQENVLNSIQNFLLIATGRSVYFGLYVEDEEICRRALDNVERCGVVVNQSCKRPATNAGVAKKKVTKKQASGNGENLLLKFYDEV